MLRVPIFKPFSLLVTGGPGWLADAVLSRLGESLPALTRVRCLVHDSVPDERVEEWKLAFPSVREVVRGDLLDEESLNAACEQMQGGVVLHCAAVFHPEHPNDWMAINRDGTARLAEIAKRAGMKRFVFISSLAAQGASHDGSPLTEEMACHPFSEYGRSKFEAEQAVQRLHSPNIFESVIIRPGQFYGTPVPPHVVEFFERVARGKVRLVGGGKYTRSLSYIDDLAEGVIAALHHPGVSGTVLNLCDAQVYTEREIVEAAAEALGVTPQIHGIPSVASKMAHWADLAMLRFDRYSKELHLFGESHRHTGASCAKARQILGFEPKTSLADGMRIAVDWARDHNLLD